jgi:hypothetical protein
VRIDWVIPARYAELAGDGTMSILGAGVDTLLLPAGALPSRCEMFLALRVAGTQDEWASGRHVLSATLIFPSGTTQEVMRQRLASSTTPPDHQQGMEIGLLLPAIQRWAVSEHGLYTFELAVDGRRTNSISIMLRALEST